jgi:predicted enzyme related to lactoylglutathione lyase
VERTAQHAERLGARIGRRFSEGDTSFVMLVGCTGEPFAIERTPAVARSTPAIETPLELWTRDLKAATSFYAELLGWSAEARGRAQAFCLGGVPIASVGELDNAFDDFAFQRAIGRVHHDAHRTISHWMPYCPVRNLDDVLDRCRFFGGRVVVAPTALPVGARTALVRDPQGVHVGLREI